MFRVGSNMEDWLIFLGRHLEHDHTEIFSLPHWEKIAIEQRKEKPELATRITEAQAGHTDFFERYTFNL